MNNFRERHARNVTEASLSTNLNLCFYNNYIIFILLHLLVVILKRIPKFHALSYFYLRILLGGVELNRAFTVTDIFKVEKIV
jgi:hypothetical protein